MALSAAAGGVRQLADGATYTFAEIEGLSGVELANRARRLAGVDVQEQAPAARPRAPRRAGGSSAKIPRRSDPTPGGRLGDRLARS